MVLVDIIKEHLEEVDFLWHYRNGAMGDRLYTLDRLAELEERLFGHLERLVLVERTPRAFSNLSLSRGRLRRGAYLR
jgi:hypothetical protein